MNNEVIDQIRSKLDIVQIIGEYLPLTARGKNYFGVCPFHEDHHPSMSVSTEKQIYKCFSCGASGNVFQFVMDYENLGFPEVLQKLAAKAGIVLEGVRRDVKSKPVNPLFQIYEDTLNLYVNNLYSANGKAALSYLKDRGLSEPTIKEFKIGLALNKSDLINKYLHQKVKDEKLLSESGLVSGNYDVFQNRIMFPYMDLEGRVVAFSGRIYNTEDQSKYINTKETAVFKKGELLFNYHVARDEARLKRHVIVVEGVMDVIRLYENGIKNVVAIMGSSVTKQQMTLLKRLSNNIYFCLDGDAAGEKGTLLAIKEAIKLGMVIQVIKMPKTDPDEYLLKNGIDKFMLLKDEALAGLDYKVEVLSKKIKENDMNSIKKYLNEFSEELVLLKNDPVMYVLLLKKLSQKTSLEEDLIKNLFLKAEEPVIKRTELKVEVKGLSKIEKAEKLMLYYMVNYPEIINNLVENGVYFHNLNWRNLYNKIVYYDDIEEEFVLANFMTYIIEDEALTADLKEVLAQDLPEELNKDLIKELIEVIIKASQNQLIEDWQVKLKQEDDIDKKIILAQKILEMKMEEDNGTIN